MITNRKEIVLSNCETCKTLGCGAADRTGIGRESSFFINTFKASGAAVLASVRVRPSRSPRHLSRRSSLTTICFNLDHYKSDNGTSWKEIKLPDDVAFI